MAEFKSCNFCGRGENKVNNMFTAGTANICDECVMYVYKGSAKVFKKGKEQCCFFYNPYEAHGNKRIS